MALYINFILDKSGSMQTIERDVIGGFNRFLADQKKLGGSEPRMTLTLFDTEVDTPLTGVPLHLVPELTDETYRPGGNTALLDATGKTIRKVEKLVGRDDAVLTVIFTDGAENSSKEYTREALKKLIEKKRSAGWEFMYMGANVDAFAEAGGIGINAQATFAYYASASGTQTAYSTTSTNTSNWRVANDASLQTPPSSPTVK